MDLSTLSFVTPDMFQNAGDMLELLMATCNQPPKALAIEFECSVDAIYAAIKNIRPIPAKAAKKLAEKSFMGAITVAFAATGFSRIFGYQKVDRHVQPMILRFKVSHKEAGSLIEELPVMLLDKNSNGDLTPEEIRQLTFVAQRLIDLVNIIINLIWELEGRYELGLASYLRGKEKPPVLVHRRSVS